MTPEDSPRPTTVSTEGAVTLRTPAALIVVAALLVTEIAGLAIGTYPVGPTVTNSFRATGAATTTRIAAGADVVSVKNLGPGVFTGLERRLMTTVADQFDPAMSANLVVYTDFSGVDADVWYMDLSTGAARPVSTAPGDQQLTGVSGNRILFTDWNTMDVLVFDVATGLTENLTWAGGSNSFDPAISHNLVAWTDDRDGNSEIYARDLSSGEERRITHDPQVDQSPAVGDGIIAWERCDRYACDVLVYEWAHGSTRRLTATPNVSERFPDVSGRTVVFQAERGTPIDVDVAAINLDVPALPLLALPGDQENPHISGDFVSFNDSASGTPHIGLWQLSTGEHFQVTDNPSGQYLNDIDGNRIVYSDNRAGTLDIYMFEFTFVTDITPPDIVITGCPTAGVVVGTMAAVTVTVTDAESGVAGQSQPNGQVPLDTSGVGGKTFAVTAVNGAGLSNAADCEYQVIHDVAPSVTLTAPANGATVFGTTVPISVMASDDLDVARVDFFVNNMAIGTDTTPDTGSLYRAVWNSTTVPDSAQTTITAVACDAALNCTTVAAVVNVSNVGLVAAFRFDELTGNSVVDAATHAAGDGANNGTFAAGVTRVGGVSGGALEFDGLSGMVTVPDAGSLDVRQMTLEAWVKPNTSAGWRSVILKQWTENPWAGLAYSLYANSDRDGGPGTYIRPSGWSSDQGAVAPVRLAPGVWHHLAATYDGTRLRLYVNGFRVASPAVSTPLTTSGMPLFIGGNGPFGEFFSGTIDEVRIYNRALSLAEVRAAAVRP